MKNQSPLRDHGVIDNHYLDEYPSFSMFCFQFLDLLKIRSPMCYSSFLHFYWLGDLFGGNIM
jgi:hypothetical protein